MSEMETRVGKVRKLTEKEKKILVNTRIFLFKVVDVLKGI